MSKHSVDTLRCAGEFDIPPISGLAWAKLQQTLDSGNSGKKSNALHAAEVHLSWTAPERVQAWKTLSITALPGWETVAALPPDDWVLQYEHWQATLAKKQRATGERQDGVFYTSRAVARYLTAQTLGAFLAQVQADIEVAMQGHQRQKAELLWQAVRQVRVIDPACGTGVFLVEALQLLARFYQEIGQQYPDLELANPAHFAVRFQLAGIDLDPLSVMITELRLAQWAAGLDGQLSPEILPGGLLGALAVGDTLLSASEGLSATHEQSAAGCCTAGAGDGLGLNDLHAACIHQIAQQQWHFILGNPPYVSEVRGQAQRFQSLQGKQTPYYQAKMDLCDGFLAWAIDHLHPAGQLAYVLPAYWSQRSGTASLRRQLWQAGQLREVWTFEGQPLFKHAPGHHTGLLIWQKQATLLGAVASTTDERGLSNWPGALGGESILPVESEIAPKSEANQGRSLYYGVAQCESDLDPAQLRPGWITLQPQSGKLLWGEALEMALLAKLSALPPLLGAHEIQQGIVIPQGRLKPADRARLPVAVQAGLPPEPGVFVLTETEVNALQLEPCERALLKPYFGPTGFEAFQGFAQPEPPARIIYTDLNNRKALENDPVRYARVRAHLDRFSALNTSAFAPYGLHRARQGVWFEDANKIMAPRQVLTPAFAPVPFPAYGNEGFLVLRPEQEDLHWCCALLNSHLAWFWFYHHKRKGVRLQIDKEVLRHFPQPAEVPQAVRETCIELARQLALPNLRAAERARHLAALNACVYQAYRLSAEEVAWIEARRAQVLKLN